LPVTVALQTNLNAGIAGANVVSDPAKKDAPLGWAALTGRGRAVAQVYAGKGGKVLPAIQAQPGNQFCQATYSFTIPAGQSAALWHLHGAAADLPAASKLVASVDEAKLLQAVAKEVRALIVNVRQGGGAAGAVELPRGGSLDVVELRNGDRLTGTIREPMYKLLAPYGTIELPPDRVLGLLNVGRFRPRQLLVTTDGQVLGGTLAKETLDVELSGGQVTPVPLRQVARTGYRGRSGDPDAGRASTGEPSAPRPTIFLRDGDRVAVGSFAEPVTLATRYGQLSVPPPAIASIAFVGDAAAAHGAHAVHLTDGSVLQAFVTAPALTAPLEVTGQTASFPLGDINRAILAPAPAEVDDGAVAVLRTTTGDTLVGTINGTLKLDTAFDTIALPANELRGLSRGVATDAEPGAGASDVQVTTWDGGTLSGRLQDAQLDVRLVCGVELKVSVSLLADYTQPAPQPSGQVLERIRAVVAELSADDWKQRDRAEAQLVGLGPSVGGVLRQLRATVPAEAQQRIDAVLQQLDAAKP
ncbi:MAG TPA: hypothetical protein VK324_04820, partial [Tepidisphaeraceae bacterium]|nr:hypothetical protein [Tepidisphaeraceae bacterium]